jgi:hypothetical protein
VYPDEFYAGGLIDQLVPHITVKVCNIIIGCKDAIRAPIAPVVPKTFQKPKMAALWT